MIRKALSDAVDDELLDLNRIANYCYQRKAKVKTVDDIDPLTLAEQTSILAIADPQLRHQLQFAFWTGDKPIRDIWTQLLKAACVRYR